MKFWNRRNKIEFFHNEPSILDNFPIIESKDLKLKWVKKARNAFENSAVNTPFFSHITRCPAIFDLFKYGYVILLHKDVIIRFKGNTEFEWQSATDIEVEPADFGISGFDKETVTDVILTPPWSANFIVKFNTGWNVIAPKGVKFLQLPIAYPDTFEFTASIGIFNPAVSTQINFPMFWNGTDKETLIKAGTPLGHLIPLTEKKYQWVQRVSNYQDKAWIQKVKSIRYSTFWPHIIRKKMVDMYNKHWKR
jgi:hypothetical protein